MSLIKTINNAKFRSKKINLKIKNAALYSLKNGIENNFRLEKKFTTKKTISPHFYAP